MSLAGLTTLDTSNQNAENLHLRPHDHRDQLRQHVRPLSADFPKRRKFTVISEWSTITRVYANG
jgi:hypothetical protein